MSIISPVIALFNEGTFTARREEREL